MTVGKRNLRALLGGLFAAGAVNYLGHLLLLAAEALDCRGSSSSELEQRCVAGIAWLAGAVIAFVLLRIRRPVRLCEQAAILGMTAGAAAVLVVTVALELASGPLLPLGWEPPRWLPVMSRSVLVADVGTASLPAAMLLGAAAGYGCGRQCEERAGYRRNGSS